MTRAATPLGRELQDAFGAEDHEIPRMLDEYEALARACGCPGDPGVPVGDWLRGRGMDPDGLWRAALERVRAADAPVH